MAIRKKQRKLGLFAVTLFTLTMILFIWYEWGGGRTSLNNIEVLALNQDVFQGITITEEMVTSISISKDNLKDGYLRNIKEITGKEAKHFVPKETPIVTQYFDEAAVVLDEGQVIAQIPSSWITSMPQTLRRNDKVYLYATDIPSDENTVRQVITYQNSTSNATGEETDGSTEPDGIKTTPTKNAMVQLYETHVAYVKDGSNREVYSTSSEGRKDASASVSSIEIVTTAEDFKEIERKINEGSFLIVMYSDNAEEIAEKGE